MDEKKRGFKLDACINDVYPENTLRHDAQKVEKSKQCFLHRLLPPNWVDLEGKSEKSWPFPSAKLSGGWYFERRISTLFCHMLSSWNCNTDQPKWPTVIATRTHAAPAPLPLMKLNILVAFCWQTQNILVLCVCTVQFEMGRNRKLLYSSLTEEIMRHRWLLHYKPITRKYKTCAVKQDVTIAVKSKLRISHTVSGLQRQLIENTFSKFQCVYGTQKHIKINLAFSYSWRHEVNIFLFRE